MATEPYRKYTPEEVFLFHFKRELTPKEVEQGIILNEYGNVPTHIGFLDYFAGVVRRLRCASPETYAKTMGITESELKGTLSTLTGRSIYEWTDFYLMLGVYEMLADRKTKLKECASEMGFSQYSVFSRYFKTRMMEMPSEMGYLLRSGKRNTSEISGLLSKYYHKEFQRRRIALERYKKDMFFSH